MTQQRMNREGTLRQAQMYWAAFQLRCSKQGKMVGILKKQQLTLIIIDLFDKWRGQAADGDNRYLCLTGT